MIITLTTDFGPSEYVAAMKGVILGINPVARLVDVRHDIEHGNIREGAFAMFNAAPHFPFAFHIGVVDPGVGTDRRGLAVVCEGAVFVGPDNGLLMPAAKRMGVKEVRSLENPEYWRSPVHPTFHGRDVFGPVAAHLTLGAKVVELGPSVRDAVDLDFGGPEEVEGGLRADVLYVDRFGNVVTNIPRALAESRIAYGEPATLEIGGSPHTLPFLRAYGLAARGTLLLTIGSHGFLELAANGGSAASDTKLAPGDTILLRES